jgi:Transposase DDE domain
LAKFFDHKTIWDLAKATKFIQRKSKLCAVKFLTTLMFIHQQGKDLSLLDICGDLYTQHGLQVRKQSIQERFNEHAVAFMKSILSMLLENQIKSTAKEERLFFFNRIRIKDSTRFTLPTAYAQTYNGLGGAVANSESMISIQYEYDLLSSSTLDLRLTTGTRNDQLDAKENTHDIAENDLFIRDLGYSTLGYLRQIINGKAYFLNRLGTQTTVYNTEKNNEEIDFLKCQKKIKKHNLPYLQYNVIIGKDAQVPCRLIIYPVDQDTYEKRVRKTTKQAKSYGHQVSDAFKSKAQLTLYITNVPEDKLPAPAIKKTYGLRWQIELFFKIWKSQANIDNVKEMKLHRFECQLIAKLLWLIIHWKIFQYVVVHVNHKQKDKSCSMWKYYKHAYRVNPVVRDIITKPAKLVTLLYDLANIAVNQFNLEEKKGKISHYKTLTALA